MCGINDEKGGELRGAEFFRTVLYVKEGNDAGVSRYHAVCSVFLGNFVFIPRLNDLQILEPTWKIE